MINDFNKPVLVIFQFVFSSPAREISAAAKRAVMSQRVSELAEANVRDTMNKVQFNPQAFVVSQAALKAHASSRIVELAQPIVK